MPFVMQTNSVLCQVDSTFSYTIKVKFQTQDRAMFQANSGSPCASPAVHAVCMMNEVLLTQSALSTAVSVTPATLHTHASQKILLTQPIGTLLFRQSGSILR